MNLMKTDFPHTDPEFKMEMKKNYLKNDRNIPNIQTLYTMTAHLKPTANPLKGTWVVTPTKGAKKIETSRQQFDPQPSQTVPSVMLPSARFCQIR